MTIETSSVVDPRLKTPNENRTTLRQRLNGMSAGSLGSLRIVLVLAFIWIVFNIANPAFISPTNLTNLALQCAAIGVVSIGVVITLLLGEIDLSVGSVSGMCAGIVGVLSSMQGWPAWAAIAAGVLAGAFVGLIHGVLVTWLEVPSFVVTLAGFLGWAGVQLAIVGNAGTISVTDTAITGLANYFIPYAASWVLIVLVLAGMFAATLLSRRRRARAGLEVAPLTKQLTRPILVSVAVLAAVGVLNYERGVPLSLGILVALVVAFSWLITRTRFGRHVLAVGGNEEAARRVGVRVKTVKILVFVLASAFAAAGGVLVMARLLSVDASAGSGNFLLYAIAGPVIAGVSLYGGRGSIWAALLGAFVIGSIQNGMNLLSFPAWAQAIVTALVLLAAVILDSIARRQRKQRR
ncbi:D-xylose transport system permease protein [Paenarthrobacter nicotinovorans]|uniref:sugar ABC transporter permease n=1 Tax=Paenarthrobacter nicotinovorans TaxID=29320 RepID=UPI00277F4EBC|nr:sugar ABC transporter permease [Paenarthrobacter nicotinovorans]MDP9933809.1 D-xylose transport system permease protein [Paenarthrobacter nicotinovorans]